MKARRPLATGLAMLFLFLLLAGLATRFWASNRIIGLSGPTHIAVNGGQVVLFAAGELLRLSSAGELLDVQPLERTGLAGDPVDLRFANNGELLVAGQRPASIRSCEVTTWDCQPVAVAATGLIERQLKVLADAGPDEWLLTDARGDTLWRLSPAAPPRALLPAGTLAGPNDLAFADDGALWVADTDHRRIVELVPTAAGAYAVGREHSAVNEHTVGKSYYPMMLARAADGRWWVTQAADFSAAQADLLIYDLDHGAQARIGLPDGAYPTDVAAIGDAALVTDMDRFAVYRVAGATRVVSLFGDDRLQSRLAEVRQQRNRLEKLSRWALAVVLVCGALTIAAAFLASPAEKRWTRPPPPFDWDNAPAEVPRVAGVHWLERNPAVERALRLAGWLGLLLLPLLVLGLLTLYLWMRAQAGAAAASEVESKLSQLGIVLLLSGILLIPLVPVMWKALQQLRNRLGTDGRRLYIRLHDGREIAADPAQLLYTDRAIIYREHSLPLMGGKQRPFYQPGEVETWLGPLLRQANKLSATEALRYQWRHRDSGLLWRLAVALVLAAVLIVTLMAL